jgi:hypothetical protein
MVHHDAEPLRVELSIDAPEFRYVGVDREFLARKEEVREDDGGFDQWSSEEFAGGLEEALVPQG